MELRDALNYLDVPFAEAGQHQHVRVGNVGVDCFQCSPGSSSYKLSIHIERLWTEKFAKRVVASIADNSFSDRIDPPIGEMRWYKSPGKRFLAIQTTKSVAAGVCAGPLVSPRVKPGPGIFDYSTTLIVNCLVASMKGVTFEWN